MSSLFLLYLLFYYWRKFSSSRCAARISLWRSFTRCRAAFSLLSLRFRDGFWWYLLALRALRTPSFIIRFLSFVIARSGWSWRLSFTVSIWSILGWGVQLPCSNSFLFSLHEYCTTTCWVCQVACCRRPQPPGRECTWPRSRTLACCLPLFLVALWYVWDMVWVVVCWAAVD